MSIFTRIWDLRSITLAEGADGMKRSWIMLFPQGRFTHPQYGKLDFTASTLSEIKRHFDTGVRGIEIALDGNHDQDKATGWVEQLEQRPAATGQPAGLWARVRWTKLGEGYIKDQIYRYFSPEFGPHRDERTGKVTQNVLLGGGLTNRPFLKDMPAVALRELVRDKGEPMPTRKRQGQSDLAEDDEGMQFSSRKAMDDSADGEEYAEDDMEMDEEDAADGGRDDEAEGDTPPSKGKPGTDKFAPMKKGGKGGKMSEGRNLREAAEVRQLREMVLKQGRKLYEQEIDSVLAGWEAGKSFTFDETESATKNPDGGVKRSREGKIVISPKAARAVRSFMLSEGFTLSESTRNGVLDLVQVLLGEKFVDLSQRGSSIDMDARKTTRGGQRREDDAPETEINLAETAAALASKDGKTLSELPVGDRERYFYRAAHEVGY